MRSLFVFLLLVSTIVSGQPAYPPAPVPADVTAAEYFINTDPGFGNGTPIPVTSAADLPLLLGNINPFALQVGAHRLYIRTRNANGNWSLTSSTVFAIYAPYPSATPVAGNVVAAEYFIDTDPGFGSGTSIPLTAALDLPSLAASINTSLLTQGIHRLYVRTRNSGGAWSLTNSILMAVVSTYASSPAAPGNITRMEYFFDADPGFGNGTSISFTPGVDINNHSFVVNTSTLLPGLHYLFVRSKDDWSLTQFIPLTISGTLPLSLTNFAARKEQQQVLLYWSTENESAVSHFEVERSKNGIDFQLLSKVGAKNNNSNRYEYRDAHPLPQLNYYRLKMVDADGTVSYSDIRPVLFSPYGKAIKIYPNPVTTSLQVQLPQAADQKLSIQVYSHTGVRMRSWVTDAQQQLTVPVADLAAGIYILQISTGSVIYWGEFVKQ